MKTRISKASISIALSLAVPLGFLAAPNAVAAETSTVNEVSTSEVGDQLLFETEEQALALFSIIESIPDEVLEAGDAATHAWLEERLSWLPKADVWGCTLAIGKLLVTTAVPAAKLVKIKNLIKALGGVKEAVKIMWGASFRYEKLAAMGGAIADLANEILGIKDVREKCFN